MNNTCVLFAKLLTSDFKRAFSGWGLKLSLLVSVLIASSHIAFNYLPIYRAGWSMPISLFARWIGGEGYSFFTQLLFLIFPILSILPYGTSYFEDKESGYLKQLYIRAKKISVLSSKYITAFVTGMVATAFPLVFNLLVSAMLYPAITPQPSSMMFSPTLFGFMCQIFVDLPWLYCLAYIFVTSIFFGLFSCIGLACGSFFKRKVYVLGFPFIVYLVLCVLSSFFGINNPMYIFHPAQLERATLFSLTTYVSITFLVSIFVFFWRGLKSETY